MSLPNPQSPKMATSTLPERLHAIKIPQTNIVLSAVEDTIRDQKTDATPTAYFAVILSLLSQSVSSSAGVINKDLATSVVYLLDIVTPFTPPALLRSKFSPILSHLGPALAHPDAEAPLLRPGLGCLETILCAQDAAAWALPPDAISPRRAVAGLLSLAMDHRPKVRKRAQAALTKVLQSPPPTPSLDHPAAVMCAETSLKMLHDITATAGKGKKHRHDGINPHEPILIHALQLIKTVAAASGGWPSQKIEALCELLLSIAKSRHEYLIKAVFDVFETIFEGMADEMASAKLPRLIEVISELRPSQNDAALLPSWIAILTRGFDVSAQVEARETFQKLPDVFQLVAGFLASSSHEIRVSASEGLISLALNCIPESILRESTIDDEKVLEKLARSTSDLLTPKYHAAWMEVFKVLGAVFDAFKWRASPLLSDVAAAVGELRGSEAFTGKTNADEIIGRAVAAMGPEAILQILPLNLVNPPAGQPGRAWMLPILREHVSHARLAHFRSDFVPLSAALFQRIMDGGENRRNMEKKIFETVIQQIWALLPGYSNLPVDLVEAFDQTFAEQLANVLYQQVQLRTDLCRSLQVLVECNQAVLASDVRDEEHTSDPRYVSRATAQKNLEHLAVFAGNMLAVLFNVYSETLPQNRGHILGCINAFLSITPEQDVLNTFAKIVALLEESLGESAPPTQAERQKQKKTGEATMPPMSHTFMEVLITISIYLPVSAFGTLFSIAAKCIQKADDPALQKKGYKLIPRLAESEVGRASLSERNRELQQVLMEAAEKASAPARAHRLLAIQRIVADLPPTDLHFIPSILSEVVICTKEVNEKARIAAYDLLVAMGEKMKVGGTVVNSRVPHMPKDAPDVQASLEEYFTMVSAGLAGSTPHMISASIMALTRALFHFKDALPEPLLIDLVTTMDLFLTSKTREVIRCALGFIKVCVISLPEAVIQPRLGSLVPHLMAWSHEHKARVQERVKHILERMMRRFGSAAVLAACPSEDHALITKIRKLREKRKRKRDRGDEDEDDGDDEINGAAQTAAGSTARGRMFESEFEQAIYGSDDDDDELENGMAQAMDDSDGDGAAGGLRVRKGQPRGVKPKKQKNRHNGAGQTFIIEGGGGGGDDDNDAEPLDLLDRKSLAHFSTRKPIGRPAPINGANLNKKRASTNSEGKLVFNEDEADDSMMLDAHVAADSAAAATAAIDAYVEAVAGQHAVQRGQRGRLKFSTKREKSRGRGPQPELEKDAVNNHDDNGAGVDAMDVDDGGGVGVGAGVGTGAAGFRAAKHQRRGLGVGKGMARGGAGAGGGGGGGVARGPRAGGGVTKASRAGVRGGGRGGSGGRSRGRGGGGGGRGRASGSAAGRGASTRGKAIPSRGGGGGRF